MKKNLFLLRDKIDALSLRERVMVFAAAAGSIIFLLYSFVLNPMLVKQAALRSQVAQQQNNVMGIDAEIMQTIQNGSIDPDAAQRLRLQGIKDDVARRGAALRAMQRGLVAPDKIVGVLESLLKEHRGLRLLSLTTLPVSGVNDGELELSKPVQPKGEGKQAGKELDKVNTLISTALTPLPETPAAPAKPAAAPPKSPELLYRHAVEMTLQGSYADMVSYMAALESMPTQLFWVKVKLNASDYPKVRLTLLVYTLSLDQKWLAL